MLKQQQNAKIEKAESGVKNTKVDFQEIFRKNDAHKNLEMKRYETEWISKTEIQTCSKAGCKNIAADDQRY